MSEIYTVRFTGPGMDISYALTNYEDMQLALKVLEKIVAALRVPPSQSSEHDEHENAKT